MRSILFKLDGARDCAEGTVAELSLCVASAVLDRIPACFESVDEMREVGRRRAWWRQCVVWRRRGVLKPGLYRVWSVQSACCGRQLLYLSEMDATSGRERRYYMQDRAELPQGVAGGLLRMVKPEGEGWRTPLSVRRHILRMMRCRCEVWVRVEPSGEAPGTGAGFWGSLDAP